MGDLVDDAHATFANPSLYPVATGDDGARREDDVSLDHGILMLVRSRHDIGAPNGRQALREHGIGSKQARVPRRFATAQGPAVRTCRESRVNATSLSPSPENLSCRGMRSDSLAAR